LFIADGIFFVFKYKHVNEPAMQPIHPNTVELVAISEQTYVGYTKAKHSGISD